MSNETRSLWEVYESETEPWKRGRTILVLIGLFYFIIQALFFAVATFAGSVEQTVVFAVNALVFWFVFYLIWIGVHWLRWVCGAWNIVLGFCLIIWGWRDVNPVDAILGVICFVIGVCFCLSPSVYVFAHRQRESMRWIEAVLIAAACFLALLSLGAAFLGLSFLHQQRAVEASRFGDEAAQRVYKDLDMEWALAHVSARSLKDHGEERMRYFLGTVKELGKFEQIFAARAAVQIGLRLPNKFRTDAAVVSRARTVTGPIELHALLFDTGDGWEIDRMWWTWGWSAENSSPPK
jgi:hypothetical protein